MYLRTGYNKYRSLFNFAIRKQILKGTYCKTRNVGGYYIWRFWKYFVTTINKNNFEEIY